MNATAVGPLVLPFSRLSRRVRRARLPGRAPHRRLAKQADLFTAEVAEERRGKSRRQRREHTVWNSGAYSLLQTIEGACPERSSVQRDRDVSARREPAESAHPERSTASPTHPEPATAVSWQSRRTSSRRNLIGNVTLEKTGTVVDSYTWDPENRLSVWNSGAYSSLQTFSYDPSGLRVRRVLPTRTDNLLNDDQNLVQIVTGDPVVYQHLPGVWGSLFSVRYSNASKIVLPDFQGHSRFMVNSSQAITETAIYDAWGAEVLNMTSGKLDFRSWGAWGYFRDSPTRSYVRARELRRDWGRWLSVDPIGFDGGDWNLLAYGNNQPTIFVDPSGLQHPPRFPDWCEIQRDRGCASCGPSITSLLRQTVEKIKSHYVKQKPSDRTQLCKQLVSLEDLKCLSAWDIRSLTDKGGGYRDWVNLAYYHKNGCTLGDCCKDTVRVFGQCHLTYNVNYVAFGVMWKLCQYNRSEMSARILAYKCVYLGAEAIGASEWASAGYDGWPSARTPESDKTDVCPIAMCRVKPRNTDLMLTEPGFTVTWQPGYNF